MSSLPSGPSPIPSTGPSEPADRICPYCGAGNLRTSTVCFQCSRKIPLHGEFVPGLAMDDIAAEDDSPSVRLTFRQSWELSKVSLGLLRDHPFLLVFPTIAGCCALGVFGLWLWLGGWLSGISLASGFNGDLTGFSVAALIAYLLLSVVSVLTTAALVGAAARLAEGLPASAADGWRAVPSRFWPLVGWALFAATAGIAIALVSALFSRIPVVGAGVRTAADIAWTFATYFMVPVILFERWDDIGDSLHRSGQLFVGNFGRTFLSTLMVDLLLLSGFLVAAVLVVFAVQDAVFGNRTLAILYGGAALAIGYAVFIVAATAEGTLVAVLYLFATTGKVRPDIAAHLSPLTEG